MADRRRRVNLIALFVGLVVIAALAFFGRLAGDEERIRQMWATAEVHADRTADVHEVIDYHFPQQRHGIYRDVPGLQPGAPIHVSADAPDQFTLESYGVDNTRIRIGDPDRKIDGNRRYRIDYPLPQVMSGEELLWNGVGPSWQVPMEHAHVEAVAAWRWEDPSCRVGDRPVGVACRVTQPEPGRLVAEADDLDDHEGMLLEARRGGAIAAAPTPSAAPQPPGDDRLRAVLPLLAMVVVLAAAAMAVTARVLRRAGRDLVGGDLSPAGAAFATDAAAAPGVQALDDRELMGMVTTEFAPPPDLQPWQGGLLLEERVRPEHKVAWLIGAAVDGEIELTGEDRSSFEMERRQRNNPTADALLDTGFAGRNTIKLGKYDKSFSTMWKMLDGTFEGWGRSSELWDAGADRRRTKVIALSVAVDLIAAVAVFGGAYLAARHHAWLMWISGLGALAAGAALTGIVRAWELRRRTPVGTALRLRVESFRRFLAESEAQHAEEAARRGVLRQYTAWAVAVGEVDHWSKAVSQATNIPDAAGVHYAAIAPALMASTSSTSTAPSSSGGGGGGGGGGFGGGGGGSW